MTTVNNSRDILDSRDVLQAFEDLDQELDELNDAVDAASQALQDAEEDSDEEEDARAALAEATTNRRDWIEENPEHEALRLFIEEAEGYAPDFHHGCALIRDDYFEEYARELLSEIGDLPRDIPSYIEIDWKATARNIRMDYTSAEYDGVTYWVR